MKSVHLLISGKVQGVFFRKHTKETADKLNIKGWVRNLSDGSVEVEATADEERLREFIKWCHIGPERARVDNVKVTELTPVTFKDFEIRK